MLFESGPIGDISAKEVKTDRKKDRREKYRKRKCAVEMFALFFLGETEISCLHAIGKKNVQKRNNGVNLGQVGSCTRLLKNKRQRQIH